MNFLPAELKTSLVILIVVLIFVCEGQAVGQTSPRRTNPTPITAGIPFVTQVTPRAAPGGAVIKLTIQSGVEVSALPKYRLSIGGVTARFYPIYGNDSETIAAVVPDSSKITGGQPTGALIPVEILFFDPQENGGNVFDGFAVLVPGDLSAKQVEIASIRSTVGDYFDVAFDDEIPRELWGRVSIYFDNKEVEIVTMEDRLFTVRLPVGVSRSQFDAFARIGRAQTSTYKYPISVRALEIPSPSATPIAAPFWSSSTIVTLGSLGVALGGLLLALYFYRLSTGRAIAKAATEVTPNEDELHLPEELPPDLIHACAAGECVLYAGAGLSAQSGLPTWKDFVQSLLDWALKNGVVDQAELASYRGEVERGQADPVADSIVSRLTTDDQHAALNAYLQKVFLRKASPSALHSQLKRINFAAVLTANFDTLLEGVYEIKEDQVYTASDSQQLLGALTRRAFFILKLYGKLDRKETVIVAPAQYENAITGNTLFSEFMQTLFLSRTLLFVGASLEGIESYLRGISFPKDIYRRHVALVAVQGKAWRAKAEFLERRYGIKVYPFTPTDDYSELKDFINRLTDVVAARQDLTNGQNRRVSRLKRVTLENIGPFEKLDLDLGNENRWHIFLGDNGVGKSTVLKAISLALCGKEAQQYAGRLLRDSTRRSESTEELVGTITLETDNKTSYVTTIKRDKTGEVELISTTARPLEAEGWLALGFPPLRTLSWEAPKGPEADIRRRSRPVVSDLLPLVSGDVDPRLDKLKQWIVNLDYQDLKTGDSEEQHRRLIQKLFDTIGEVAEGMKLTYRGVGKGNRILVETEDGTRVPLEGLSQGTISLIGWVGIFIQRLYEVFGDVEDPTKLYALILMDEIDAHMHPRWQRTLVTHLKELFPEAQFIATTHSPLVVGGMDAREVVRFARDADGNATTVPTAPDMTLGYTDQVLTSLLFGLETTLDRTTELKKKKFYDLDKLADLGEADAEYERLKSELIARVPPPAASYDEKHAKQLEEAEELIQLGTKLRKRSPTEGQILLDRGNKLLEMIGGGKSSDQN